MGSKTEELFDMFRGLDFDTQVWVLDYLGPFEPVGRLTNILYKGLDEHEVPVTPVDAWLTWFYRAYKTGELDRVWSIIRRYSKKDGCQKNPYCYVQLGDFEESKVSTVTVSMFEQAVHNKLVPPGMPLYKSLYKDPRWPAFIYELLEINRELWLHKEPLDADISHKQHIDALKLLIDNINMTTWVLFTKMVPEKPNACVQHRLSDLDGILEVPEIANLLQGLSKLVNEVGLCTTSNNRNNKQ